MELARAILIMPHRRSPEAELRRQQRQTVRKYLTQLAYCDRINAEKVNTLTEQIDRAREDQKRQIDRSSEY